MSGSGPEVSLAVPSGTEFIELERTVLTRGTGEEVLSGDLVSLQFTITDPATGEVLDSTARIETGVLHVMLDPAEYSIFVAALECLPLGSEVVFVVPGDSGRDLLVYTKAVAFLPTTAQGTPVAPAEGMPTVVLDADGAPTITIPDAPEPTETRVELLQQGSGAVVQPGDMVVVQYRGVKWSDGEEFDSSWSRGTLLQIPTNRVVNGFRLALEGQQIGSQVLVVMTPEDGYGPSVGHALEHETLVFVVDILAASPLQ